MSTKLIVVIPVFVLLLYISYQRLAGTFNLEMLMQNQSIGTGEYGDGCSKIKNSNFTSIKKYEVGLSSKGVASGNWRIAFKENSFAWGHSDIIEKGSFDCQNNILDVHLEGKKINASYDQRRGGILIWDGLEYKKIN